MEALNADHHGLPCRTQLSTPSGHPHAVRRRIVECHWGIKDDVTLELESEPDIAATKIAVNIKKAKLSKIAMQLSLTQPAHSLWTITKKQRTVVFVQKCKPTPKTLFLSLKMYEPPGAYSSVHWSVKPQKIFTDHFTKRYEAAYLVYSSIRPSLSTHTTIQPSIYPLIHSLSSYESKQTLLNRHSDVARWSSAE